MKIGILPYYYFLLLLLVSKPTVTDWNTAVLLLPSTFQIRKKGGVGLEDCRIYTSFYLDMLARALQVIGILPYYYFLLLMPR